MLNIFFSPVAIPSVGLIVAFLSCRCRYFGNSGDSLTYKAPHQFGLCPADDSSSRRKDGMLLGLRDFGALFLLSQRSQYLQIVFVFCSSRTLLQFVPYQISSKGSHWSYYRIILAFNHCSFHLPLWKALVELSALLATSTLYGVYKRRRFQIFFREYNVLHPGSRWSARRCHWSIEIVDLRFTATSRVSHLLLGVILYNISLY